MELSVLVGSLVRLLKLSLVELPASYPVPPASLAGSQNSAKIAVISAGLSDSVDLPASYPDRWIRPEQIRIVHK